MTTIQLTGLRGRRLVQNNESPINHKPEKSLTGFVGENS